MTHCEASQSTASVVVAGQPLAALPQDLYIPPDALRVFLETFEGPLDLLLYLIRKQNLDIVDIPVATIAAQYMAYIELMSDMAIELAGEYLLMAAMLAEIKSRMLLPRPIADDEDDADDPKAELIRRLQEYEQIKQAGDALDGLPRVGRDMFEVQCQPARLDVNQPRPSGDIERLLQALSDVLTRAEAFAEHRIERESLSVREYMAQIMSALDDGGARMFSRVVDPAYGRAGVIVVFLAVLELVREALIAVSQPRASGEPQLMRAGAGAYAPASDHD